MKYVYPKLPSAKATTPFFRLSGNGLANCLFTYARSIVYAEKNNLPIIEPTWFNISLGPYLRRESDKRHYKGLFKACGEISGLKKILLLLFRKKEIKVIEGLGDYFVDILEDSHTVKNYIINHIGDGILDDVNKFDFNNCVAVHVRLGDYVDSRRTPLEWYIEKIERKIEECPRAKFLLFSDGSNEQLKPLIKIPQVQKVFFGNAIADIIAISR